MTQYEHDGDPLSLRRSAFVPYEPRQPDRAVAAQAATVSWRTRIQVALEQRRRQAINGSDGLYRRCFFVWTTAHEMQQPGSLINYATSAYYLCFSPCTPSSAIR
ncbi:hypothetical protein C8R47DRAFT_1078607 [Mycena vitilis]|nr:hypothetical protein C8R47DRAFT_1078607 [Mycena vitilis]